MEMPVTPIEMSRRAGSRFTGRLRSVPILALSVHSACNCRCVMCDIWKANAAKTEISLETLERHLSEIRRLRVQRVMLTGGEPLLHSNLWAFCRRLRAERIQLTLVTTGLLIERHAGSIAELIDEVVISVDGPPDVHDAIRRVPGGFVRIEKGVRALHTGAPRPSVIARCVLQKANYQALEGTIYATRGIGVDRLSFLAADVNSSAFNRPEPWPEERRREIALSRDDLLAFAATIRQAERACDDAFKSTFVQDGVPSLWRIYDHYAALAGLGDWPRGRCNAPWVSAVLETDGRVRPCFFQPAYGVVNGTTLNAVINSRQAIEFRNGLDVRKDDTCRRCVCRLALPITRRV